MNFEKNKIINPDNPDNKHTDPRAEIEHIRSIIYSMGANDSEMSELDGIVAQLKKRELSGKEAVTKAKEILERKQSYH